MKYIALKFYIRRKRFYLFIYLLHLKPRLQYTLNTKILGKKKYSDIRPLNGEGKSGLVINTLHCQPFKLHDKDGTRDEV